MKVLYLMRGCPGSGKSTEAARLGQGGVVVGSDDFFMQDGEYKFDPKFLPEVHKACQYQIENAMRDGISPVVVDNTNLERWEARPYVEMAQRYGYVVKVAEPQTPWRMDAEELARRNRHGVPLDRIQKMVETYHQNNPFTIFCSRKPTERVRRAALAVG